MTDGTPKRVIWITTDHMRLDCVGAYGDAGVRTPNIDQLAAGGVNFLNCFTQNPVCTPSRVSFMTGLYPQQTGVTNNGHCLPPDFQPTVAGTFKAAGYQTAQIGKLHFQPHEDNDFDPRPRHAYGFDVFWPSEEKGCYEGGYLRWLRGEYPQHVAALRVPRSTSFRRQEKKGSVVDVPFQASHPAWLVDTVQRFLHMRKGSRQFIHLGFFNPHPPLNPVREAFAPYENARIPPPRRGTDEWLDKPEPLRTMLQQRRDWTEQDFLDYRRFFYALVTELDLAVGALLDFLRQRKMLDDTLVVFSSDHGDMCGDHSITHKGPHFFDEVMRVPLILYWPAGLGAARRDVEGLVEMVDLLPTLLGLCGGHVPETIVGRSLAPELLAGATPPGRQDVFAYHEGPVSAMVRTERWKYIRYNANDAEVLYDLSDDRPEVVNRAAEPACAAALQDMRRRMLSRALAAGQSPLPRIHCW